MDTSSQTPPKSNRKLPGKKAMILVILALILGAGAVGATYYRNRPEAKKAADSQQEAAAEQADPQDVQARYNNTLKQLDDLEGKPDSEQASIYSSAAFDGAALGDSKAKDYAKKALELYGEDKAVLAAKPELKRFIDILTEISTGKYDTAKAFVKSADE